MAKVQTTQGTKTLTVDTAYDGLGRPYLVTGPYLGTSAAGAAIRASSYDDLGRLIAIAGQPITGTTVSAGTAAWTYADYNPAAPSVPASVTSYTFAVPLTYTLGFPPQTSDARQTTTFYDALGRSIQVRERMGGSASGSPSAGITQNLPNFRVAATIFDGAGRVRAELEPFYSASGAFRDYRTSPLDDVVTTGAGGLSTALHAQLHTYDGEGREVCSAYVYVPSGGAIPSPLASCQSNFSETSAYVRATAICYRAATEKLPALMGKKIFGPELTRAGAPNCSAAARGPEQFTDATETLYESRDIDGNGMQLAYDLMRNTTGIVRISSDGVSVVASSIFDMAGRLKHRTDPDIGTQDYAYFASGRPKRLTYSAHALGGGLSGNDYVDLTYDLGRPATRNSCKAGLSGTAVAWACAQDVFAYDAPYLGGAYANVAGQLAYVQNANTTIAYGYSPEGLLTNRDQWLTGLSGAFTSSFTPLLDAQHTSVSVSSAYSTTVAAQLSYDSFLRPVQLASGTSVLWAANAGGLGAYDAAGRIASAGTDNNSVQSNRMFAAYSGLQSSSQVRVAAVNQDLYRISAQTYVGERLASYRDELALTTYSYTYTDGGRLKSMKAIPDSASSPTTVLCVSFNRNKAFSPAASLGNLERIRTQQYIDVRSPQAPGADTYNYTGTDVSSSGSGPDAPASISTLAQTTSLLGYDYSGRIVSKNGGAEQLTYDALGRLTSVTRANEVGEVLTYDPMGQVVGRLSGGALTYYVGKAVTASTPAPLGCTAPGCTLDPGAMVNVDVHLVVGGRRVVSIQALQAGIGRALYYYRDRLGSVVATSTTGGVPGATYRYDAYGDLTTAQGDSGGSASELGFTGKLRLSKGLYLMGNRVYDAKLRQFLQPDIQNPMSYTYAGGDPVNFVDPTGRSPQRAREDSEAPVPGVETRLPGSGSGGNVVVFFEGTWQDIKDVAGKIGSAIEDVANAIADAATAAWDTVTSCFGLCGGSGAPPPHEDPHIRVVNDGAPSQQAGSWWFNMWDNWGGSSGGPTAGDNFARWIKDYAKSFEKCAYCDKNTPYEELHLDHVDPKANGGNAEFPNAAPACAACNWLKGAMRGPQLQMLMQWLRNMKGLMIVVPDAPDFERRALHPFPSCPRPPCET